MAISDKIGNTNSTVVNQLCRSDGVLFRPERPATAMDSTFLTNGPKGEMWHTYASDNQQRFFVEYIMITNLTESYVFSWKELQSTQDDDNPPNRKIASTYVTFEWTNPGDYHWLKSNSSDIVFPSCPQNLTTFYSPFHLFVFVPVSEQSNWILFGEMSKQLPISRQRFASIEHESSDRFRLQVIGVNDEQVTVTIGHSEHALGKIDFYSVQCSFTSTEDTSNMEITCDTTNGCQCGLFHP